MRRRWILAALGAIAVTAAACTPAPQRQVEAPPAAVLRIATSDSMPYLDPLVAAFQAAHPQVKVEKVPFAVTGPDTLSRLATSGTADVVPVGYGRTGLADLRPYAARSKLDESAWGQAVEYARTDGILRGLPVMTMGLMVAFNKELTGGSGVTIPTDGWTWDEFRAAARQLTRQIGGETVPGFTAEEPEDLVTFYIEQKTGKRAWQTDETTLRDALAFFDTMVNTDRSLAPAAPKNYKEGVYGSEIGKAFFSGRVPMSIVNVMMITQSARPFAREYAPMPYHTPARRVTRGSFALLGMPSDARDPALAWEFIAWAAGPEGAKAMATAGWLPAYMTPDWEAWLRRTHPTAPRALLTLYGTKYVAPVNVSGLDAAKFSELLRAANRVLSGSASVDVAVADWKVAIAQAAEKNR